MFDSNITWFCSDLKTEAAKQIGIELEEAIKSNNHKEATRLFKKVKKYMKKRVNENYFSPMERIYQVLSKLDVPENTAFIHMGVNCILIELYYEIVNGYDESREGGKVSDAYKSVIPMLSSNISEYEAIIFYNGIRCGIIHQGQTKDDTALTYQHEVVFEKNGDYYLSNPKKVYDEVKRIYKLYWEDISTRNYSDAKALLLIKKYNNILNHIS